MIGNHVRKGEIKTLLAQTKLWTNSSNTFHQTWIKKKAYLIRMLFSCLCLFECKLKLLNNRSRAQNVCYVCLCIIWEWRCTSWSCVLTVCSWLVSGDSSVFGLLFSSSWCWMTALFLMCRNFSKNVCGFLKKKNNSDIFHLYCKSLFLWIHLFKLFFKLKYELLEQRTRERWLCYWYLNEA